MAAPYASNVLTGTLGVEDVNPAKQVRDVSNLLWKIVDKNYLYPFTALLSKLSMGPRAFNPKIEWIKKDIFPRWDTISSVSGAGTPTLTITPSNIDYYTVSDMVEFPGRDTGTNTIHGVVTAKSTTITVQSIDGSNFPSTIEAGDSIHILGPANEDWSQMPTPKVVKDINDYNYIHFIRVPFKIGILQLEQKNYTGPERAERRIETGDEIKMSFERILIFGERGYRAGTNGRQYFMRGLKRFIQQSGGDNILDWSSGLNESNGVLLLNICLLPAIFS